MYIHVRGYSSKSRTKCRAKYRTYPWRQSKMRSHTSGTATPVVQNLQKVNVQTSTESKEKKTCNRSSVLFFVSSERKDKSKPFSASSNFGTIRFRKYLSCVSVWGSCIFCAQRRVQTETNADWDNFAGFLETNQGKRKYALRK